MKTFDLIAIARDEASQRPKPDLKSFTHIRAYHCCRPIDPESYWRDGILVGGAEILEGRFRSLFKDIDEADLDRAVANSTLIPNREEVDLALDYRWLFQYCPHYALTGSERILDFAAAIDTGDGIDHRERLRGIGTPSMVVVDIPLEEIDNDDAENLEELLQLLTNRQYDEAFNGDGGMIDFTVSFCRDIPPEWIIDIEPLKEDGGKLERRDRS